MFMNTAKEGADRFVEVFRGKDARCPGCGGGLENIRVSDRSAYCRPKDQQG